MAQRVTTNKRRPAGKPDGASPFKRAGLHKLTCPECPGYAYVTVAMLETIGYPVCPCGRDLEPERLELALLLGRDDLPIVRAYADKCSSVAHGQAHTGRDASTLESPEFRALYGNDREPGLLELQRRDARARRLSALNRGWTPPADDEPDPATPRALTRDTDPIPF
jgi:hypothetical protein